MPDITAIAGKVAGIISLVAGIPYIIAILRGQTKPNRATWLIWFVVGCVVGVSYYSSGARDTMWVPITYIIGPFVITILSFKYGEGGWTKFDRYCLLGACASLVLWWMFNSPLIALITNLFIDFMGALPTLRKSYYEPEKENGLAWALSFLSNLVNIFAVKQWTFAIAIYPIYMIVVSGLITALVLRKVTNRNI